LQKNSTHFNGLIPKTKSVVFVALAFGCGLWLWPLWPDDFYLPHMEYEGSFGFVSRKKKLLLIFTF
jgi:hypothetical protein